MEFVPTNIHIVVISILGTGALGLAAGAALLWFLYKGDRRRALQAFATGCALGFLYLGALLVAALASDDVLLGTGEHKYFCGVDCHIAYSIVDVTSASALGEGAEQVVADGRFYVVTLRTWFDESTTSASRGDGLLYPAPRVALVVDDEGRYYSTSIEAMKALGAASRPSISFGSPLRPGDDYCTTLVYDVAEDATNPRLWVRDRAAETELMIGHENSPFHGKVTFALEPQTARTATAGR